MRWWWIAIPICLLALIGVCLVSEILDGNMVTINARLIESSYEPGSRNNIYLDLLEDGHMVVHRFIIFLLASLGKNVI